MFSERRQGWFLVFGLALFTTFTIFIMSTIQRRDSAALIEELIARMSNLESLAIRMEDMKTRNDDWKLPTDAEVAYASRVVKERPAVGSGKLREELELRRRRWKRLLDQSSSIPEFIGILFKDGDVKSPMGKLNGLRHWWSSLCSAGNPTKEQEYSASASEAPFTLRRILQDLMAVRADAVLSAQGNTRTFARLLRELGYDSFIVTVGSPPTTTMTYNVVRVQCEGEEIWSLQDTINDGYYKTRQTPCLDYFSMLRSLRGGEGGGEDTGIQWEQHLAGQRLYRRITFAEGGDKARLLRPREQVGPPELSPAIADALANLGVPQTSVFSIHLLCVGLEGANEALRRRHQTATGIKC